MSVFREELADRLRSRRVEIEKALQARLSGIRGGEVVRDPEYRERFRSIIPAAFNFSLAAIESREGEVPPIPAELLTQARLAARHAVGLDTVLRGYVAGATLMDDFILDECGGDEVQRLLRSRAAALEHLLSQVSDEHESERRARTSSRDARMLERVTKLLLAEPQSPPELEYDLTAYHVALLARGPGSRSCITTLAKTLGRRALVVKADPETVWAWLGSSGLIHPEDVQRALCCGRPPKVSVGLSECASGLAGWRHTHRQAKAALPVALRSATRIARYADVCLIASAMQDSLLTTSLHEMYVQPLVVGRDEGRTHIQTLRAYFAADRNGTSTAAALGVTRQAVANRLRVIESRIGQPLATCATAIEIALTLDESGRAASRVAHVNSGPASVDA